MKLINPMLLKESFAFSHIIEDGKTIEQIIDEQPDAQPEIIRCKDCKRYNGRVCGIVDFYNTADDFCSRAERRTDE